MTYRAQVVAEARRWISTPYVHQHRAFGVGVDCVGLVIMVCRALGIVPPDFDKIGYPQTPDGATLKAGCDAHMIPRARIDMQPGDVLLMRFATDPQHMAIVGNVAGDGLTMIHAYAAAGKVVEHRIAPVWRARIVQAYSLPGVA